MIRILDGHMMGGGCQVNHAFMAPSSKRAASLTGAQIFQCNVLVGKYALHPHTKPHKGRVLRVKVTNTKMKQGTESPRAKINLLATLGPSSQVHHRQLKANACRSNTRVLQTWIHALEMAFVRTVMLRPPLRAFAMRGGKEAVASCRSLFQW